MSLQYQMKYDFFSQDLSIFIIKVFSNLRNVEIKPFTAAAAAAAATTTAAAAATTTTTIRIDKYKIYILR